MDIKVIAGLVGLVISLGSLMVAQGELLTRIDVLESKQSVNLEPIIQGVSENERNIAVIRKDIEQLKEKNNNPLLR
jgi:hypothetical protein